MTPLFQKSRAQRGSETVDRDTEGDTVMPSRAAEVPCEFGGMTCWHLFVMTSATGREQSSEDCSPRFAGT